MHGAADSFTASSTVRRMIEFAYNLRDFQLAGGPDWISSTTWDIAVKVDQPAPNWSNLSSEVRRTIQSQRMQAVFAQRFGLKCHFEIRQLPVYNLVVAKAGSKFKETAANAAQKGSISWNGNNRQNRIDALGIKMNDLAASLSGALGRTVIDKTNLTGLYDFTLNWTSDSTASTQPSDSESPPGPSLVTAVQEQLGLRLESAKGPVPVFVIDSIERPSEN